MQLCKGEANSKFIGVYLYCQGALPTGDTKEWRPQVKAEIALIPPKTKEGDIEPVISTMDYTYNLSNPLNAHYRCGVEAYASLEEVDSYLDGDILSISIKIEEMNGHRVSVKRVLPKQTPVHFDIDKIAIFYDINIRIFESEDEDEDLSNSCVLQSIKSLLFLSSSWFEGLILSRMKESTQDENLQ
ncbi:hypothetical protein BDF14DRAFT_523926 [Spinellus fusiger]|nr:hypothetical protein BDF14DRAFT_523926 [Spinellus fusiger]